MLERIAQGTAAADELLELIRVGQFVQMASYDGLRLVPLGDDHRLHPVVAFSDPAVSTDEVHEVRALHQQLRHFRIVVVFSRQMAVGALLGLLQAYRMRCGSAERLPRESFGGNRLVRSVDYFAV